MEHLHSLLLHTYIHTYITPYKVVSLGPLAFSTINHHIAYSTQLLSRLFVGQLERDATVSANLLVPPFWSNYKLLYPPPPPPLLPPPLLPHHHIACSSIVPHGTAANANAAAATSTPLATPSSQLFPDILVFRLVLPPPPTPERHSLAGMATGRERDSLSHLSQRLYFLQPPSPLP